MSKYVFVSDQFCEDGFVGGGEKCSQELINVLIGQGHTVQNIYSFFCSPDFINSSDADFFIVSNFIGLPKESYDYLRNYKYFIYEHDHKYLKSRDPSIFENYIAPKSSIINYDFYKNAYKILCQSSLHKKIIELNLELNNIDSCVNFWSEKDLLNLEAFHRNEKKYQACFADHVYHEKNSVESEKFCIDNNYKYIKIPFQTPHKDFCEILSYSEKFVFFPKVLETLSRVCVEAKCLNADIIGNSNISYLSESWFNLKGLDLINFLRHSKLESVKKFES